MVESYIDYICQPNENLNGKLRKKLGGQAGGQAKIWGHGPPRHPLRIATDQLQPFGCVLLDVFCSCV